MPDNKHLDLSDRMTIEAELDKGSDFRRIALAVDKDPSTISKEVRAHLTVEAVGGFRTRYNACANRFNCEKSRICQPCKAARRYKLCKKCGLCNAFCDDFVPYDCPRLKKPPYVCNGCGARPECTLKKQFYHAQTAHGDYRDLLSDSRSGISFSEDELHHIDSIVSPLILQGQSPHHICVTNQDTLMISERTLYRLIDQRLISAKNIDLPRKVRFRTRKKKKVMKIDKRCREGRTFHDFQKYLEEHPDIPVTQMDSVEGRKGGKVLLTIHFVKTEFMLAFLRDHNDSRSVINIFNAVYDLIGRDRFSEIFQCILTDNGSEFSNPSAIELDDDMDRRTRIFYCDPQASWQKGSIERNHEFIRCFIPKGKPFDQYSQYEISLMMDHINSYRRESLNNKSPYEMFRFFYGSDILDLFGCRHILPGDVTLNRSVFQKEGDYR